MTSSLEAQNRKTNFQLFIDQVLNSSISLIFLGMIYRENSFREIGYLSTTIAVGYIVATSLRITFITSLFAAELKNSLTIREHLREIINLFHALVISLITIFIILSTVSISDKIKILEYLLIFGGVIFGDITKHFMMFREEIKVSITINFAFVLIGSFLLLGNHLIQDKSFILVVLISYFWIYSFINITYCKWKYGVALRRKKLLIFDEKRKSRIMLGIENLISSAIYLFSLALLGLLEPNYLGMLNLANFYFTSIPLAFFTAIIPIILRQQKNQSFSNMNIALGLFLIPLIFIVTNLAISACLKLSSWLPLEQLEIISEIRPAVVLISAATVLNWYFFVPSIRLHSAMSYRLYKYTFSIFAYTMAFISYYTFGALGFNLISIIVFLGAIFHAISLRTRVV